MTKRWRVGRLLRWALLVATLTVAGFFLAPRVEEALRSLGNLHRVGVWYLVIAFVAQALSLLAFSVVTWSLIEPGNRPSFPRIIRVDLVTVALSHAVPIGAAAGTALGYELLEEEGVSGVESGFVKITQTLLSSVLLQTLLGVSLALEIVVYGQSAATIGLVAAGTVIVASVVTMAVLLGARPDLIRRIVLWARRVSKLSRWIPAASEERVGRVVDELGKHLRSLIATPARLAWVAAWSLGNWLFDLACLWASMHAFRHPPGFILLMAAFCLAQVVAALPISPAGLGVVEGALVPVLTSFGTPGSTAVLGVLTWRLFNYWFPLPTGLIAYLSIVAERRRRRRSASSEVGASVAPH